MIDINLLPSAQRRPIFTFDRIFSIGLLLLAAELLAVLVFVFYEQGQINKLNAAIDQQKIANTQMQAQVEEVYALKGQLENLKAKAETLERIKQSPLQVAEILTDVGYNTPSGVWYNSMTVVHSSDGGSVSLAGDTSTYREVADLMLNLDGSSIFEDAALSTSSQVVSPAAPSGGDVQFSVVGTMRQEVIGQ